MPVITTKAAASSQGYGEFTASAPKVYIEDIFSTYLYTGNGSTQTITNNIDLSTKGGLVWVKGRSGATDNALYDTARGATKDLVSNSTAAETTQSTGLTAFNTTGFNIGALAKLNTSSATYASWTFRKQPKFFDMVTYTGNGTSTRNIPHNLGSTPGFIIVKRTSGTGFWFCWHKDYTGAGLYLNDSTIYPGDSQGIATSQSSTDLALGASGAGTTNANGATYVAYLFAHNAGGFGLSGTDNVISCGSFSATGSGQMINLGWEAQFVLIKSSSAIGGWYILDQARYMGLSGFLGYLQPDTTGGEPGFGSIPSLSATATGFIDNGNFGTDGRTMIYIAIRRGPMKVPTSGTSVFKPFTYDNSAGGFTQTQNAGFPTDFALESDRGSASHYFVSRLQGPRAQMSTTSAADEATYNTGVDQQKFNLQNLFAQQNSVSSSVLLYCFRRAPSFFDVVCYSGTGSAVAQPHNLAAVPELVIVKKRTAPGYGQDWYVRAPTCVANGDGLVLNSSAAQTSGSAKIYSLTSTSFTVANDAAQNTDTYVAYLFATCPGVSKVGSYTGSGTTKQIDCGFTGGARFILIKRTDSTGDWYVYDTARGIVSGDDPYLFLNSTAAEVTNTDYVDTYSAGFELSSTAPAGLNANGGTFVFFAVA